jgi:hypothetical protein
MSKESHHPAAAPELGKLNIELSLSDKQIEARIYTSIRRSGKSSCPRSSSFDPVVPGRTEPGRVDVSVGTFRERKASRPKTDCFRSEPDEAADPEPMWGDQHRRNRSEAVAAAGYRRPGESDRLRFFSDPITPFTAPSVYQMMETEQSKRDEEAAWVTRCLAGERDAFEPLVRRYQQHIYRLANRILGCRESALDITQDTLVKAYNNLAGFKPDQSFRNWVLTIATHLCFDSLRRNRSFLNYFREKSGMIRGNSSHGAR